MWSYSEQNKREKQQDTADEKNPVILFFFNFLNFPTTNPCMMRRVVKNIGKCKCRQNINESQL